MPDAKFNVLYFGNWGLGRAGLEGLLESPAVQVVTVFTRFEQPASDPFLNQVYDVAVRRGLRCLNADKNKCGPGEFARAVAAQANIDFIVVCCFDRILPPELLALPRVAAINVHGALLPRHRGIKPLENTLVQGDARGGVTLHEMTAGVDDGDIILQDDSLEIRPQDTYGELFERQAQLAKKMVKKFFTAPLAHLSAKRPQDHSLATLAPRLPFPISQTDTVAQIKLKK